MLEEEQAPSSRTLGTTAEALEGDGEDGSAAMEDIIQKNAMSWVVYSEGLGNCGNVSFGVYGSEMVPYILRFPSQHSAIE